MRVKASLLALGLVLGACGMQVSAASTENEIVSVESIQPRAEQCGNCGQFMLRATTSFGSWRDTTQTVQCSKYNNRRDFVQEREVYTTYECRACGYRQTATGMQTRINCTH